MPEPRPWNPCSLPGSKPLPPGGEAIDSLSASPAAQATPAADAEFGTIDRDFGMTRGARRRAMTTLPADPTRSEERRVGKERRTRWARGRPQKKEHRRQQRTA